MTADTCNAHSKQSDAWPHPAVASILSFVYYSCSNVVNWVIRTTGDRGAHHLSNSVTDYANESPRIGIPKTYLETANQVSFGVYALQLMV